MISYAVRNRNKIVDVGVAAITLSYILHCTIPTRLVEC